MGTGGHAELVADEDRPGSWLLLLDRIRQSYVDPGDPTHLEFPYLQALADWVEELPAGPIDALHVGGGAATLARWVAATRPRSAQLILEPDAAVTALVSRRLPFRAGSDITVLALDGRTGTAARPADSADLVVLDAFAGGRVPADLTTAEAAAEVARVLRPGGMFLLNIADGPPFTYQRRVRAALAGSFGDVRVGAEPNTLADNDFGNIVIRAALPGHGRPTSPGSGNRPLTDADSQRSPAPPEDSWRVPFD